MIYFASGSNRVPDIRGFAAVGHPIGVAAPELSENAIVALEGLAGRGVPVFVDSGAFSEMTFTAAGPVVSAPISDAQWSGRMALYLRLARALGGAVSVVAPDRIGDQVETLRRLALFAPQLVELRRLGARVLVPIQKGHRTQAEFVRDIEAVLGFSDFVHAIPAKKNATTMTELRAYVTAARPAAVHLLGLGIRNIHAVEAAEILRAGGVVEVSCDSNLIAANVGRGKPGSKPRRLTAARDDAARMIAAGNGRGCATVQELGIVLCFGDGLDELAQAAE